MPPLPPHNMPQPVSNRQSDLAQMFAPYMIAAHRANPPQLNRNGYSLHNLILDVLVHKAFPTARQCPGFKSKTNGGFICVNVVIVPLNFMAKQIETYFSSPIKNQFGYDAWHQSVGSQFIDDCASLGYRIKFGTAQKVINVAMKHLYCYGIAGDAYFEHCHVALDSMTYVGRTSNARAHGFYRHQINGSVRPNDFCSLNQSEYQKIQDDIRSYMAGPNNKDYRVNGQPLTPFKAEFYIWPRYKR